MRLGGQVLTAAIAGIFCGVFFGPLCRVLKPVGDVYIMLLQMVALPYIWFTLVHGLGSLSPATAKKLFKSGWPFWLTLWAILFAVIYLSGLLIPKPSLTFIERGFPNRDSALAKNFLSYLVPENPFYDLANNIVPAIAVFGLIVGVALMHLDMKEPLLSILERANQTIEKILKWLAILSPIGIFAHLAVASGTVYFEDLLSIQFYVISFILIVFFMVLWVLPILLSSLTPLTYRQSLKAFRAVCLLPFATALPTIAFPFISQYMRKLGEEHAEGDPNFHATSQTVMPFCYSFGQIGNCLILFYIFFLSFYYRHPFGGGEKTLLSLLTIPLSVGSSTTSLNAVTFLIGQLDFPQEAIDLFTETMAITLNFQVLLSIASILTFIILVLYSYYGLLKVQWKRLFSHLFLIFGFLGLVVAGGKEVIHLDDNFTNLYRNLHISDVIENPVPASMIQAGAFGTERRFLLDSVAEPFDEVLRTGVLKVGYDPLNMPYCYWNLQKELVGYDIAFAYQLARDLDCRLEFVPLNLGEMGSELAFGKYDLGMAAIIMNEERIKEMDFTHPYTEQDNVLITSLAKHSLFMNLEKAQANHTLKLGARGGYLSVISRHFPLAEKIVGDDLGSEKEDAFIKMGIDAWVSSHVPAFVWCLSHPQFVAIDYGGLIGKRYFGYPLRTGSRDWASFLNNWLSLKKQSGFEERMRRYWIEGQNPRVRPPRWSFLRNILHWDIIDAIYTGAEG